MYLYCRELELDPVPLPCVPRGNTEAGVKLVEQLTRKLPVIK